MGKKGTEIAKQAASLILVEDDLAKMVDAIAMGRRIYTNLKKAIQYIISIHIPIVLTVFLPLALGWIYPNIFSPVHIIFLELIMGPTCSIIYENEPMEQHSMSEMPREMSNTFFNWKELTTSIIQGLMITAGCMFTYLWAIKNGADEPSTRTMVFLCLISANIFLTLVNRSFYYSILTTLGFKNNLVIWIIGITLAITAALIYIPVFSHFFEFQVLDIRQTLVAGLIGFVSVIWFEFIKWYQRLNNKHKAGLNSKKM
jgi:Ca2+-transporting ATPase